MGASFLSNLLLSTVTNKHDCNSFVNLVINHYLPYITELPSHTIITGGKQMKNSLLIGAMLGIVTATALYCGTSNRSIKRAKRSLVNKIEDVLM